MSVREIEFFSIDVKSLDLTEEERALLESCLPEGPVEVPLLLTEERIDMIMVETGMVTVN